MDKLIIYGSVNYELTRSFKIPLKLPLLNCVYLSLYKKLPDDVNKRSFYNNLLKTDAKFSTRVKKAYKDEKAFVVKHAKVLNQRYVNSVLNKPPTKYMNFLDMRKHIRNHYGAFVWPPKATSSVKLTLAQNFISHFFTPQSDYKGMLLYHDVDTSALASTFSEYKILRVTDRKQLSNLVNKPSTKDRLKKTLLIIDHKLGDMTKLKVAVMNSYEKSGKDSVRLLVLYPTTNDPIDFISLLNLCKEPNDQIPEVMITKREFLDAISGHVNYIDCKRGGRPGPEPEVLSKVAVTQGPEPVRETLDNINTQLSRLNIKHKDTLKIAYIKIDTNNEIMVRFTNTKILYINDINDINIFKKVKLVIPEILLKNTYSKLILENRSNVYYIHFVLTVNEPVLNDSNENDNPKYVSNGTYGCVMKPAVSCSGTFQKERVSKLFKDETDADEEYNEHKKIVEKLDPDHIFTVVAHETCYISNDLFKGAVDECKNFDILEKKRASHPQIVYDNGGVDLVDAFHQVTFEELFIGMESIFKGLTLLNARKYSHLDIKPANIVYNKVTKKMYLIDFGLSKEFDDIVKKNNLYIFEHPYRYYPPEFDVYAQYYKLSDLEKTDFESIFKERQWYSKNLEKFNKLVPWKVDTNIIYNNIELKKMMDDYVDRIDVYMLGVSIAELLNNYAKNEANIDFYNQVIQLVKKMTNYAPNLRITPEQAYEEYKTITIIRVDFVPKSISIQLEYKNIKYNAYKINEKVTIEISSIEGNNNITEPLDSDMTIKYSNESLTIVELNTVNKWCKIKNTWLKFKDDEIYIAFNTDSNYSDLSLDICKQVFENDADATKVYDTFRMFVPLLPDNVLNDINKADSVADKLEAKLKDKLEAKLKAKLEAKAAAALLLAKQNARRNILIAAHP